MTLREIHDRLRLSTRTGRAELGAAGITERSFRRWLAGASPLYAARQMLLLAARVAAPGEAAVVETEIEGTRVVVLREEAYRALTAPVPPAALTTQAERS